MRPEDMQYDKLDQVWAQYDERAQSVCQSRSRSIIDQLKRFISFLEQQALFVDFNQTYLPQVNFNHWMQEARLKARSPAGGNGSLFPGNQRERLALQLKAMHAIVEKTVALSSFCTDLLCRDQTDVKEEVFIKKIFKPFAVQYKWEVKHQTHHLLQQEPSEAQHEENDATLEESELEPLQDLAFVITGYTNEDGIRDDLIQAIRRSCYRSNIRIICRDDIETGNEVTEQTLQFLHSACIIICEVTKDHPNLHKVLDYVQGFNPFIFVLAKEGTSVPKINNGTIIRYCNLADLESQLNRKLKDFVKENF